MIAQCKISRRCFLSLMILPTVLQAKPLVDLERNLGLFSDPFEPLNSKKSSNLNLYNDPEPELSFVDKVISKETDKIIIENDFQFVLQRKNERPRAPLLQVLRPRRP